MAGLDSAGTLSSSSNTAGIDSGAKTALAGAIERISARQTTTILLNKSMGYLVT